MQLKCYLLGPIGPILQYQKVQRRVYPPIAKNFFCVEYKVLHLRELPHVRQHWSRNLISAVQIQYVVVYCTVTIQHIVLSANTASYETASIARWYPRLQLQGSRNVLDFYRLDMHRPMA